MREYRTPGSVRGVPGNRHPYRDYSHPCMNKIQILKYCVCLIILVISVFGVKIYSETKIDGAIEAANVL